jgi:hypothetical protein
MLDGQSVGPLVQWITLAWTVGLTLYVTLANRYSESGRKVEGLQYDLNGAGRKIQALETQIASMPQHGDLAEIYREIRKQTDALHSVAESVASIGARVDSVHQLTARMDNYWRQTK